MDTPTPDPMIHLRPFQESDVPLVMNSWLKSYRDCPTTWGFSPDEYYDIQKKVIVALLKRCNVVIACDPEDHDQAFGWAAWQDRHDCVVVHYIYTKLSFQRMGVARRLWSVVNPHDKEVVATHVGPSTYELRDAGFRFRLKPFYLTACVLGDTE